MALLLLGIRIFISKLLPWLLLRHWVFNFTSLCLPLSLSLSPVSLSQSLSWPWTLLDPFIKTKLHNTTKAEVFFELYNKENGQTPKEAEKPFPLFFLIIFTDTVGFKRKHKHSPNHDPIDLPRILTFQTHLWSYSFSKFHYPLN